MTPPMDAAKQARKLSSMQCRLLKAAVAEVEPTLHGRSEHGGAVGSSRVLRRTGLTVTRPDGMTVATELGRQVFAALSAPPPSISS